MSGLAGIVRRDGKAIDEWVFASMLERIRVPGADPCRSMVKENVALAASLLRVPGEPAGWDQPLALDDGSWIVADARLDGRESILEALERNGERLNAGVADAELILRAYRVWGQGCLDRLFGDFAFAIWDGPRRRLFCARDQFGCKPFYFAGKNGELVFSNTLRAIRRHPIVSDRLDEQAVGDFLLFDFNRNPESTFFADIRRLPPAHYLIWSGGDLRTGRYWRFPIDGERRYSDCGDYIEHFRELLRLAVRDRMRAGRAGVLMSGGMDSTAVAAAAVAVAGRAESVHAFSTVYDRVVPSDERHYATLAARRLGIPITFLQADNYEFYERSGSPGYQPPEPQNTPFYAVWMDQFRMAAQFSPVALHGNGGDEILDQRGCQIFSLARSGKPREAGLEYLRFVMIHGWLPGTGLLGALKSKFRKRPPWSPNYPSWLDPAFENRLDLRSRWQTAARGSGDEHPRHPDAYRLLQDPIWPASFESFHPGATGCRLDVRHPLLDLRLARFCLSLPARPWMEDKGLLRVAMKGSLPRAVRKRPKTPLPITPEEVYLQRGGTFSAEIHPEVRRFVDQRSLARRLAAGNVDAFVDLRPMAFSKYLLNSVDYIPVVDTEKVYAA